MPQKTESDLFKLLIWKEKESRKQCKLWIKRLITQAVRGSFEVCMNVNEEIRRMENIHDIVGDTENESEAIDNNLDAINKELGYDNNILVNGEVKIVNV
jgi:hypothetical protein